MNDQQSFIDKLRAIEGGNPEIAHSEADDILLKALKSAGWSDVAAEYERVRHAVRFWYA